METDSLLPIKLIAWASIAIAAVSAFATPALSAELEKPAPFVACLQVDPVDGSQCRLLAPTVAISIGVADGDALISYYVPTDDGLKVDRRESVANDMESQMAAGLISAEDAAYIFAEVLSSHDLGYKLPASAKELKKAVGFADSAVLSPQDQVDILSSHLQMNLGVSAVTADYLVTKLGLRILQ